MHELCTMADYALMTIKLAARALEKMMDTQWSRNSTLGLPW